jgi:hypothetical protein
VSEALSASFERLLGQKATEEQVRRLYDVRDGLQLADNDALWTVLLALEHYDALYREYPARIADEARRTLAEVKEAFAGAAAAEAKRAHRNLAEAVAAAAVKIAAKRTEVARIQGFVAALAAMVAFGALCLSLGYALGAGRVPPWTQGNGARRLIGAALGAPAGWVLLLLLLPMAARSAKSGWAAIRAAGATSREVAAGWARVLLAIAAPAALTTLVLRLL